MKAVEQHTGGHAHDDMALLLLEHGVRAETSSTSCDQVVFVDQASGAGLPSDAVLVEIDWFG